MTVRASLGQLFVRNWPIKLAALFFAIMLYVAVAAQQPLTQSFALRLAITIPPGRTVRQQPAGVTVVIAGTGSEILKLRSFSRVIRKVIPDTFSASLWRVQLTAADVELPRGSACRWPISGRAISRSCSTPCRARTCGSCCA